MFGMRSGLWKNTKTVDILEDYIIINIIKPIGASMRHIFKTFLSYYITNKNEIHAVSIDIF